MEAPQAIGRINKEERVQRLKCCGRREKGERVMDPFLLLGGLAVVIGIVGVIVLRKGRKKRVR